MAPFCWFFSKAKSFSWKWNSELTTVLSVHCFTLFIYHKCYELKLSLDSTSLFLSTEYLQAKLAISKSPCPYYLSILLFLRLILFHLIARAYFFPQYPSDLFYLSINTLSCHTLPLDCCTVATHKEKRLFTAL